MTLTEISFYLRKYFPFAILGFFFIVAFYFLIITFLNYLNSLTPTTLQVEPIFGKITRIVPSQKVDYKEGVDFLLDTIEGEPKNATPSAKVFFLPSKTTQFRYLQKIYVSAKQVGFDTEKIKHVMDDQVAVFDDGKKRLDIDVAYFNFDYKLNFEKDKKIFLKNNFTDSNLESLAKTDSRNFIKKIREFPEELSQGNEKIIYLKYNSTQDEFQIVKRKQEANAIEIDFYRPDIDGTPIMAPKYFNSQNYVVLTYDEEKKFIPLKAGIKYFEKETQKFGVYPIKTGVEAWSDLKNKNGHIVFLGTNEGTVKIKSMELGYYDFDNYQPYLQPVYVFLGENGFVAIVDGIKNDYLE